MAILENTPILIGVGQSVSHWDGSDANAAPCPISLSVEAAKRALDDTESSDSLQDTIDTVIAIRTMADSVPARFAKFPFGRCDNPPLTISSKLGIKPSTAIYSSEGGHQPQSLINEFSEKLHTGKCKAVLICGAEALAAEKVASRNKIKLSRCFTVEGEFEDRGLGKPFITDYERKNGLGFPTQTYPIFDQALRKRLNMGSVGYRRYISELFSSFSEVAASNPYAQFPIKRSAEFLATPSKDNFPVAEPYLKWHVAQETVNQGAAVILTTVKTAKELDIAEHKWIFLHGYADIEDRPTTERIDLSRSRAIEIALDQAMKISDVTSEKIDFFDIYSCFPCVVLIAAEALGIDWKSKNLTVTGGLPFFGGPGNNYSMHAVASMVDVLRSSPKSFGLVLANGGFMTKESVGIYSTLPKEDWSPTNSKDAQLELDRESVTDLLSEDATGTIESFTVVHGRHAPRTGTVVLDTSNGRVLARTHTGHRSTLHALLVGKDPLGKTISTHTERGKNFISAANLFEDTYGDQFLMRKFQYVTVEKEDKTLIVTLNRPESYNALHSAAHFELAEIFDEFERDDDLWVAIITGAGEKAFCSGNDLKATAKGGDMSLPPSGFSGLCSRYHRQKPVIAAVNGVAMGGGLEIVISCDLAVIDPKAKCALPEVKVGLFAAAGGIQRLTRQIGRKAAMELILTGRHFDAEEALKLGVVNSISEPGKTLQAAKKLADEILQVSPSAVRATKSVLNELDKLESLETALNQSGPAFAKLMKTNDFREGVTAFTEKRKPNWTNS